jgi:pimeloyl-ACP methyl ester carboxylesterase
VAARGRSSLHLVDRGARDAQPLLFIHGWGVSSAAFSEFFDRLAEHYRVIAPDLPGFGRSQASGAPVSYTGFADVLAGLLDDLEIERAHVAGISMGGGIALTRCPEVSLPTLAWNRICEFAEQAFSPAGAHGRALVAKTFMANLLGHPASLAVTVRMVASRNIVEDARRIRAPTLLLWGERDRTIPPRLAPAFLDRLANASLQVMPDTFHEMATSRPDETAAIIHGFIRRAQV